MENVCEDHELFIWDILAHADARWAEQAIVTLDEAKTCLNKIIECSKCLSEISAKLIDEHAETATPSKEEEHLRDESIRNVSMFHSLMDKFWTRAKSVETMKQMPMKDLDIYGKESFHCAVKRYGTVKSGYAYGQVRNTEGTVYLRRPMYGYVLPDGSFVESLAGEWDSIGYAEFADQLSSDDTIRSNTQTTISGGCSD